MVAMITGEDQDSFYDYLRRLKIKIVTNYLRILGGSWQALTFLVRDDVQVKVDILNFLVGVGRRARTFSTPSRGPRYLLFFFFIIREPRVE